MSLTLTLDQLHLKVKQNRWHWYFAIFLRIALAAGFLPSGWVKIAGERFTDLSVNHPLGQYLEALFYTGFYYPFIGVLQMTAAILLLIPRTATLGAVIYFPIILNICVLSVAVGFDGSLLSSPLMVLGNLYLLCWDFDKLKYILPFKHTESSLPRYKILSNRFPFRFFTGVGATVVILVAVLVNAYDIRTRNTLYECQEQCTDNDNPDACFNFCSCIHSDGDPLNKCLDEYYNTPLED